MEMENNPYEYVNNTKDETRWGMPLYVVVFLLRHLIIHVYLYKYFFFFFYFFLFRIVFLCRIIWLARKVKEKEEKKNNALTALASTSRFYDNHDLVLLSRRAREKIEIHPGCMDKKWKQKDIREEIDTKWRSNNGEARAHANTNELR